MKKKGYVHIFTAVLMVLLLCLSFTACEEQEQPPKDEGTSSQTTPVSSPVSSDTPTTDIIKLIFRGTELTGAPAGAITVDAESNAFVIVKSGIYELTGDLSNGQVRVQIPKTEEITLILNNFTAANGTSAPMYIVSADKCTIELAAGSVNRLTDATTYVYPDPTKNKPNACLYSSDDLTIKGSGTLIVQGNYNNGIGCKNDIRFRDGTVTVSGINNAVKGGDSVTVSGGTLTITGGEDGIKTDNELDPGKGYILISENAKVDITCADDVLQATQSITVESTARVTYTAGGDAVNCPGVINVAEGSMNAK